MTSIEPLPRVPGGFGTILADPPWPYRQPLGRGKKNGEKARGGLPYESMSMDEILALPVRDVAADESMLFLWTTSSHLPYAFQVMARWGFTYKQAGAWVKVGKTGKVQIGAGFWMRGAVEFFLLGVRGNPRTKFTGPHGASGLGTHNAILAPRKAHSAKPDGLHRIAESIGEGPRLELFARGAPRQGWVAWGKEAEW